MESRVQGVHIVTLIHHLSHFVTFASIFSVPLCLFLHTHPYFSWMNLLKVSCTLTFTPKLPHFTPLTHWLTRVMIIA